MPDALRHAEIGEVMISDQCRRKENQYAAGVFLDDEDKLLIVLSAIETRQPKSKISDEKAVLVLQVV